MTTYLGILFWVSCTLKIKENEYKQEKNKRQFGGNKLCREKETETNRKQENSNKISIADMVRD